jgi:hypothetical protein
MQRFELGLIIESDPFHCWQTLVVVVVVVVVAVPISMAMMMNYMTTLFAPSLAWN